MSVVPFGIFGRAVLGKAQLQVPGPDFAGLMWRYDSDRLAVVPDGTEFAAWVDDGPYSADLFWPGPGFVFVPPFPEYFSGVFGALPSCRYNNAAGIPGELDIAGQLPFTGGALTGQDCTFYLVADLDDAETTGRGFGVYLDYPSLLGVPPWNFILPYVSGVAGSTMGFGYNMTSSGTGTVVVDIALRGADSGVFAWAFRKSTTVVEVYHNGALLGASAPIADLAPGFDFGPDDGTGESSTMFSDFAGSDGLVGDIGASYGFSLYHDAAKIAEYTTFLQAKYSR